eukprot:CAMPEP_0172163572 /NCGR_PEP_ID=MMETSP1050-20130122/7347_1 /TAXON_ID=233186 /ORGANISM="Cryptomonas curvata, Strain CCAP979/52" /LENGTH=112 /DNA_ID=CAMNT_0012833779 /DNA_START=240 /DNA_END=574 /DNA_ORIENTATION=+
MSFVPDSVKSHHRLKNHSIAKTTVDANNPVEYVSHLIATILFVAFIIGQTATSMLFSLWISVVLASTFAAIGWQAISLLFLRGDPKQARRSHSPSSSRVWGAALARAAALRG